jgi:ankyrin repeat protein
VDNTLSGITIAVLKGDAASLAVQLDQFYKKNKALDQRAENATLLVMSILLKKPQVVAMLLTQPVDVNAAVLIDSCDRKTGLQSQSAYAAFCRSISTLSRDWMDVAFTPLQATCLAGDLDAMQMLVKAGAAVLTRRQDEDALGVCLTAKKYALAEFLVDQGANVQAENLSLSPMMALSFASANAPDQVAALMLAEKMISKGADPHYMIKGRYNELSAAASAGNLAMVKLLVQHGVDSSVRSDAGLTPMDYAKKYNKLSVLEYLQSLEIRN